MAETFTEQNFIERCQEVLANTHVLTSSVLVEQLRKSVRAAVGFERGECIDPKVSEQYSRMERHLLDIVRVVEAHSEYNSMCSP